MVMLLVPAVMVAVVVRICVGMNTHAWQRDKRQRYEKCQSGPTCWQTDTYHPLPPLPTLNGVRGSRIGPKVLTGQVQGQRDLTVPQVSLDAAQMLIPLSVP